MTLLPPSWTGYFYWIRLIWKRPCHMVNPSTVLVVYGCPLTYPYADFRFDIVQLARKILMLPFSNSFRFLSQLVLASLIWLWHRRWNLENVRNLILAKCCCYAKLESTDPGRAVTFERFDNSTFSTGRGM